MEDWPRRRAMVRGVSPSLSAASLLAPASSSSRATASWPLDAAQWRGVFCSLCERMVVPHQP